MSAGEFENDWEYQQAKQAERKADKDKRDNRRGRKQRWEPKGADE